MDSDGSSSSDEKMRFKRNPPDKKSKSNPDITTESP